MPFPIPPKLGLHEQTPRLWMEGVTSAVRAPDRAAATLASHPAWPPPITTTSYGLWLVRRALNWNWEGVSLVAAGDCGKGPAHSIEGPDTGRVAPEHARSEWKYESHYGRVGGGGGAAECDREKVGGCGGEMSISAFGHVNWTNLNIHGCIETSSLLQFIIRDLLC